MGSHNISIEIFIKMNIILWEEKFSFYYKIIHCIWISRCLHTPFYYFIYSSSSSSFESLQVHFNLYILMTFKLTSIYVYVPIHKSIVERMLNITTNPYEIKVFSLHPHNLHCSYILYLLFINYIILLLYVSWYIVSQ